MNLVGLYLNPFKRSHFRDPSESHYRESVAIEVAQRVSETYQWFSAKSNVISVVA